MKVLYINSLLFSYYPSFNLGRGFIFTFPDVQNFLTPACSMEYTGIKYPRKGGRSNVDYYGSYPLNPNIFRGHTLPFPNYKYCAPPCKQALPLNPTFKLGYWELLSPALFGAVGALFLSFFSDSNHLSERCEGTLFKLTLIWYGIGASVAVSFAVRDICRNSKTPHDHLLYPIGGAIVSVVLLFASEYLLLYRFFPSSFKGDVGDNFATQLFSFLYLSITSIATANLGDIMPNNLTARALIATEIAFNLFTMATAIQLLLVQIN